jgi:hypothetical protein
LANTEATRQIWESDEAWQPARQALERLLLAYDWGEAFTALNLVIKPTLDALFKEALVDLASANGDGLTAALLQDLRIDTIRSQAWSAALARYAIAQNSDNREVIASWEDAWQPLADGACDGLSSVFADAPHPVDASSVREQVAASQTKFRASWAD